MANLYKQYMRLLKKWPVDESKVKAYLLFRNITVTREKEWRHVGDLGQHIRDQVKIAFSKGENSKIEDKEKCQRYLESLERLASNHYLKEYPYDGKETATGLTREQCSEALSKEFKQFLEEQQLSRFEKFKQKLKYSLFRYSQKK